MCGSTASKSLLAYDEIPHWQRDNEFILSGYRKTTNSLLKSSESIFAVHNETISIHTHLGGALLFIYLDWAFWFHGYHATEQATFEDLVVFSIYLIGVAVCFLLSTICHITWNHSARYASLGNRLDYLGIIILMWGASVPSIYYGLRCDPHLQLTYWAMMTAVAAACAVVTMHPHFRNPTFRKYRAAMYAGLGVSGVIFTMHGILLHGLEMQNRRMSTDWMFLMALLNFVGAALYAARIPERYFPYRFDILGGSHQIFHVMVILAGLAHFAGLIRAWEFTGSEAGVCVVTS